MQFYGKLQSCISQLHRIITNRQLILKDKVCIGSQLWRFKSEIRQPHCFVPLTRFSYYGEGNEPVSRDGLRATGPTGSCKDILLGNQRRKSYHCLGVQPGLSLYHMSWCCSHRPSAEKAHVLFTCLVLSSWIKEANIFLYNFF